VRDLDGHNGFIGARGKEDAIGTLRPYRHIEDPWQAHRIEQPRAFAMFEPGSSRSGNHRPSGLIDDSDESTAMPLSNGSSHRPERSKSRQAFAQLLPKSGDLL
jgi:hypothetical protein